VKIQIIWQIWIYVYNVHIIYIITANDMKQINVQSSAIDESLKEKLLIEKLLWMAKEWYGIRILFHEKKTFQEENAIKNIKLSAQNIEDIVSSLLFHSASHLGDIDILLSEISFMKDQQKLLNIKIKITDVVKKAITSGIKEYRNHFNSETTKSLLTIDMEKLKSKWLYMEDNQKVINTISEELINTIN